MGLIIIYNLLYIIWNIHMNILMTYEKIITKSITTTGCLSKQLLRPSS